MRKPNSKLIMIGWTILMIAFFVAVFTLASFVTAFIYNITNSNPPGWLAQIFNSLLGLFFLAFIAATVSKFAQSKGWAQQRNLLAPIIDAMERIAQGDFSVRVDNVFDRHFQDSGAFTKLVDSVNTMAVELDQMERLRQEFISNVSHEIQSPLTSIRGFAQALQNDQLSPEEKHHYLSIIETESLRLSRITDDLLKLASLESDPVQFEPKPYRLDKQIRNLVLACEPQWRDKSLDLQVALAEIDVTADEDLLSQVWINLIHNSIKFTPPGGRVSIDLQRVGNMVRFSIADTGIGIAEPDQARIFERFFKADKSRTHSNGGSGLGLAITKKIVDLHRGTISVESKTGAGTRFIVCLPAE